MSVFATAGWILRLAVTVVLLATVNPVLILLVFFAIPTVAATSWRPVVERTAQERGAQADRFMAYILGFEDLTPEPEGQGDEAAAVNAESSRAAKASTKPSLARMAKVRRRLARSRAVISSMRLSR